MLKYGVNLSYIHNIRNYSIKIYNQLIAASLASLTVLLRLPVVQLSYRRVALVSYVWNAACGRYHKRDALRILARYEHSIYCGTLLPH